MKILGRIGLLGSDFWYTNCSSQPPICPDQIPENTQFLSPNHKPILSTAFRSLHSLSYLPGSQVFQLIASMKWKLPFNPSISDCDGNKRKGSPACRSQPDRTKKVPNEALHRTWLHSALLDDHRGGSFGLYDYTGFARCLFSDPRPYICLCFSDPTRGKLNFKTFNNLQLFIRVRMILNIME